MTHRPTAIPRRAADRSAFVRAVAVVVCCVLGLARWANAQDRNPIYVDDSTVAHATLRQLPELVRTGNVSEASRAVQAMLDDSGDRLVQRMAWSDPRAGAPSMVDPALWLSEDPDLFATVRAEVHRAIAASSALADWYQRSQGDRAQQLLARGEVDLVERTLLMTQAGFEACLRVAEQHAIAARFDAAARALEQLEMHPARSDPVRWSEAMALASRIAAWADALARATGREEPTPAATLAQRWRADRPEIASTQPDVPRVAAGPASAERFRLSPTVPQPSFDPGAIPSAPLRSFVLDWPSEHPLAPARQPVSDGISQSRPTDLWVFPSIVGERVVVNDGVWVRAFDRFTLEPLWSTQAPGAPSDPDGRAWEARISVQTGPRLEDHLAVASDAGLVVAVTGLGIASEQMRLGDGRVHAIEADTGLVRWSVDPTVLDERLADASIRGPAVVSDGVVVVTLRQSARIRRVASRYLAGLDLWTGELRWVRLIGSAGALPWAARPGGVSELASVDRGIVYSSDGLGSTSSGLGVIGAVEAATGRVLWIRRVAGTPSTGSESPRVWEAPSVAVVGDSAFALATDRSQIFRFDARTGVLLDTRPASSLGSPAYVVPIGGDIALVGPVAVAFLSVSDFAAGRARLTPSWQPGLAVGRAVAASVDGASGPEPRLLIPTSEGYALLDPSRPAELQRHRLERPGITLATPQQVLVVDGRSIHTYLGWDGAEAILRQRMDRRPSDPMPGLTYAQFALELGRREGVVDALDHALRALASVPELDAQALRAKAHDLLASMLEAGLARRGQPGTGAASQPDATTDLALLGELALRLQTVDAGPQARARTLLAVGLFHEHEGDSAAAVDRYHELLADDQLHRERVALADRAGVAGDEATRRARALVARAGASAAVGADASAERAAQALTAPASATAGPDAIERVARAHPVWALTPELWRSAARSHRALNQPKRELAALAEAIAADEAQIAIQGQQSQPAARSLLASASAAIDALARREQHATALQLLDRLTRAYPALPASIDGASLATLSANARAGLLNRERRARIGATLADGSQSIRGWTRMAALLREHGDRASEHALLISRSEGRFALFGLGGDDGRGPLLEAAWSLPTGGGDPQLLRLQPDAAVLLWPTNAGPIIERLDAIGGQSRWRTRPLRSLLPGSPALAQTLLDSDGRPRAVDMPFAGRRLLVDVLVSMSRDRLALVERSGRLAVFDVDDGSLVASAASPVRVVFDVDTTDEQLLVLGGDRPVVEAVPAAGEGQPIAPADVGQQPDAARGVVPPRPAEQPSRAPEFEQRWGDPVAALIDLPSGSVRHELRSLRGVPRFCRMLAPDVAVIGTSVELVGLDPSAAPGTDPVRWRTEYVGPSASDAWTIGELMVLVLSDAGGALRVIDPRSGEVVRASVDVRGRLTPETRVEAHEMEGRLAIGSERGVIVLDAQGQTVGADAIDIGGGGLLPAAAGDGVLVTIERRPTTYVEGLGRHTLYVLSADSARVLVKREILLGHPPSDIALLDGRIMLTSGGQTQVIRADAEP